MKKIGPAFSDFVVEQRMKKRRGGRVILTRDLLEIVPLFLLILAFSILLVRIFYLQVVRGDYYRKLAEGNRLHTKTIRAERGIIFDRRGRPLVRNIPSFKWEEEGKVRFLSKDEALARMAEKKDENIETDTTRFYLHRDAFSHVLGYLGEVSKEELLLPKFSDHETGDVVGKMGLEKQYETVLHGLNGKELYEVDARGKIVRFLGSKEPLAGKNLTTTLDQEIQLSVYSAFASVDKGAVVVSHPKDGSILALYSKPTFDPNLFTSSPDYASSGAYRDINEVLSDTNNNPLLNRVIGGVYPPGSTFKLIAAVAALESGAIKEDTQFEDTGILQVGEFSFGNWYFLSYGKKEGFLDVVGALRRSNDIFFYKAAEETGIDTLSSWAHTFGLGEILGIDLMGEEKGLIPDPAWKKRTLGDNWYLGDTYNLGIGQGYLLVSPLQVNMWTSVFANGGTLYTPHLVEGRGGALKKDFIRRKHIELVRKGMRESCEQGGVAWPLFDFRVKNERLKVDGRDIIEDERAAASGVRIVLACKTGTAETSKDENPHAWITVFAPFNNPEVVVTVLVERAGEGSNVAAPIAKKILEEYFAKK